MSTADIITTEVAALREDVNSLREGQVTYRDAEVVGISPLDSTFAADIPGAGVIEGIYAPPHFMPAVGERCRRRRA